MIARLHGISATEVRISETAEKTFATAEKMLKIVVGIGVTVEKIFATAEKIIRIAGRIGVPTQEIFKATGETDATIEEISRVTGDTGVITKGISERIMEFGETTKDIIPQGQIAGTDTLLNITDMHIPADLTEAEAGAKFTDVRFNKYCQGNKLLAEFWLNITFILVSCAFTIFDKIILIAFLSGLTVLIGSCADYMSGQVEKIELKFF